MSSHWGLTDNCAIEKDTFYMLKSYYTGEPMLHLLPHRNHAAGDTVRVCAMTNLKRVCLTLNGRSLGEKDVINNRAEWEVPFEAGTVTAVATDGSDLCPSVIVYAKGCCGIRTYSFR